MLFSTVRILVAGYPVDNEESSAFSFYFAHVLVEKDIMKFTVCEMHALNKYEQETL